MRRSEFWDNPPEDFSELIEFAYEHSLYACDNLVSEFDLDERIFEDINEESRHIYWGDVRDKLNDIERGYAWYECAGSLEYIGVDDRFDDFLSEVSNEMDEKGLWDGEEDDEDDAESFTDADDEYDDVESDALPEDEVDVQLKTGVFSLDELISQSAPSIIVIRRNEEDRAEKSRQAFLDYEEVKRRMNEEFDRRISEDAVRIGELMGW